MIGTDQTKYFLADIEKLKRLQTSIENPEENGINTGVVLLFFQRDIDLENISPVQLWE